MDTFTVILFFVFLFLLGFRFFIFYKSFFLLKKIKYTSLNPYYPTSFPDVSIIIPARNEIQNLRKHLPFVLEQYYRGKFEVIVILDSCTDNSKALILDLSAKYPILKFTEVFQNKRFDKHKKMAILLGVKAANYDNLLFIDADCQPNSKRWLESMANMFVSKDLILGYGGFFKEKTFVNIAQRFDTIYNTVLYMSMAISGNPYMAVGRNMGYKKRLFYQVGGFKNHYHIASGNDDLFVKDVAKIAKTEINVHPHSFVYTEGVKSFREWFHQKRRHVSVSHMYELKNKIFLSLDAFSRILFLPVFIILLIFLCGCCNNELKIVVFLGFMKLLGDIVILYPIFKHFDEKKLFFTSAFMNIFLPVFTSSAMIYNKLFKYKGQRWL